MSGQRKRFNNLALSIDTDFAIVSSPCHNKNSMLPNPFPHTRTPSSSSYFQSPFGKTFLEHAIALLHLAILAHSKTQLNLILSHWPCCTLDIKLWMTTCSHYIAVQSNHCVSSKLCFSWPIIAPFSILHADLWSPGVATSADGYTQVLGPMCNLTGFVILAPLRSILSNDLAVAFMERVLLQIWFCHIIHVDAGNKFRSVFEVMCNSLSLWFSAVAKGNHQSLSIEQFFKYANTAVTIATQDWATLSVWVPAILLAMYAWNSSLIDGTDIIWSIPAVGRPFCFLLDINITSKSIDPVLSFDLTDNISYTAY